MGRRRRKLAARRRLIYLALSEFNDDLADDALINVDNLSVMEDGRALSCEDADRLGRSYSNDCPYVFADEDTVRRLD